MWGKERQEERMLADDWTGMVADVQCAWYHVLVYEGPCMVFLVQQQGCLNLRLVRLARKCCV